MVFNSKTRKHTRKVKLRWLDPHIIEEEIASGTFKLKNLDVIMNASVVDGHRQKPYHNPEDPGVMSPDLLHI